ncbi:hypothetical protein C3L33_07747, partial [Rhododendron williamsianum]
MLKGGREVDILKHITKGIRDRYPDDDKEEGGGGGGGDGTAAVEEEGTEYHDASDKQTDQKKCDSQMSRRKLLEQIEDGASWICLEEGSPSKKLRCLEFVTRS